jgi:hypothetical protein
MSFRSAPEVPAEDWEISIGNSVVGKETAASSARTLSAHGGFTFAGLAITTSYEMSFDSAGKLSGYKAMVSAGGNTAVLTGTVSGSAITIRVEQGGQFVGEKSFPLDAGTVLLDNNIASHFIRLSSRLKPSEGSRVSLQILVPQVLAVFPAEATLQKGTYHWKANGREGTAVRWEITSPAPLLISVYQDAATGAILEADVPQASAVYRISGYSFTAESAEAARPAYFDPSLVEEKELSVTTGGFSMGATLAYPKAAKGPLPGVLLIAGSGPNDRDETIGGMKPFRDIAFGLAAKGFVVLRFDKRTYAYHDRPQLLSVDAMTVKDEFIDDSVSAFRLLASQNVDPARLTIIGHSLGAWGLPFIFKELGTDASKVKHLVFLAPAAGDSGAELLRQIRFRLSLSPDNEQIHAVLDDTEAKVREYRTKGTISGPILGAPAAYWKDLFGRDAMASALDIPTDMLFVRGSKDFQVSAEELQGWNTALEGKGNASFTTLPDLNHIFQEVQGDSTGAEYFRAGYVSSSIIELIASRIGK